MIENIKAQLKEIIEKYFLNKYNLEINIVVEEPKKKELGDLSIPSFVVVKALRKPLNECVNEVVEAIKDLSIIESYSIMGGFINIVISKEELAKDILTKINSEKESYASGDKKNETICIDYSSPNIAKPFSIGHLRSTIIGASLKLIYEKAGYNVVGINHLGDWGSQFGKVIVAYKKWGNKNSVENNSLSELAKLYVKFHQEAEKDPSLDDKAREVFKELEEGNKEYLELWKWFREESINEALKLYDMLNVKFDSYNGEAFYNDKMDAVNDELEAKGLLKEDDGAMIVDLGESMPPALIKRRDGASLYMTRDLAAVFYRKKTYNFKKALYVVGNEQKLHFNQLKEVIKKMGYDYSDDIIHVNFGLVLQDGKKMSTRSGKVVTLIDVLNEAIDMARKQIENKNPNLENKEDVSKKIGIGAVIFNDLKNHRSLDYEFNLEQMLKFEGQTGPYLQYSDVRIKSILNSCTMTDKFDYSLFKKPHYYALVKDIDEFKLNIDKAVEENAPSVICKYLLNLASDFNTFYGLEKINTEDEVVRNTNLLLLNAIKIVLEEGLRLIDINPLERM